MGGIRYGLMADKEKGKWDIVSDAIRRLEAYQQDHNQEHLVDVANLAMLEYVCPSHRDAHFSTTDDGHHVPLRESEQE